jgi:hypothetical protein
MPASQGGPFTHSQLPWIIVPIVILLLVIIAFVSRKYVRRYIHTRRNAKVAEDANSDIEQGHWDTRPLTPLPLPDSYMRGKRGKDRVYKEWPSGKRGSCIVKLPSPDVYVLEEVDLGRLGNIYSPLGK